MRTTPIDFIDGAQAVPSILLNDWICNPNTGERLQQQRATAPGELERALAAAERAFPAWSRSPVETRLAAMEAMAAHMESRLAEIAELESSTTGVTIRFTRFVSVICHLAFRAAAGVLRERTAGPGILPGKRGAVEVLRLPLGPAALIVPWNAPAPLAAHKVANALAAGCPAILKPSEAAPLACDLLADAAKAAGLPPGVFQIVHGGGDVGARLVGDPRIKAVSFTGGLRGGRAVAAACAPDFKPAQLELGGNNPMLVRADADLDLAAQGVVDGLTTLNGQWCRALGRLLVHASIKAPLMERAWARLANVRLTDSLSPEADMGPIVHAAHLALLRRQIAELVARGGVAMSSTPLPDLPGFFLAPTLIDGCRPEDTLEEIFGPIAAIHTFETDAEALALANQAPYGLAGYVFSADEARAREIGREIRAGDIKINGVSLVGLHPLAPRPAWGLSGIGAEGTHETFDFFQGTRTVGVAGGA
jgi:phenylacetaldehyde dehydrogenase